MKDIFLTEALKEQIAHTEYTGPIEHDRNAPMSALECPTKRENILSKYLVGAPQATTVPKDVLVQERQVMGLYKRNLS